MHNTDPHNEPVRTYKDSPPPVVIFVIFDFGYFYLFGTNYCILTLFPCIHHLFNVLFLEDVLLGMHNTDSHNEHVRTYKDPPSPPSPSSPSPPSPPSPPPPVVIFDLAFIYHYSINHSIHSLIFRIHHLLILLHLEYVLLGMHQRFPHKHFRTNPVVMFDIG